MDKSSQSVAGSDDGTQAAPADANLTGKTIGDFRIVRRLGEGGMGQVYLAEQLSLRRHVALKILKPRLGYSPSSLQRFRAEAEAVARATHANIVQVYAVGEQDDIHYIALEYVDGFNLRNYLQRKGSPSLPLALSIMRQCAAGLQRAAELGIVHRDIKPENILLTRKGEVKIADFGLSRSLAGDQPDLKLTQSGVTMGTPLYMSPEQVEGKAIDPRTDIYSLGVTWYHMLAGSPPFAGQNAFEIALQHVQAEPKPLASIRPDLPDALCSVIAKMMAKKPVDRYQTGRDLLKDLTRIRDGMPADTSNTGQVSLTLGKSKAAIIFGTLVKSSRQVSLSSPRLTPWVIGMAIFIAFLAFAGGAILGWRTIPATSQSLDRPSLYRVDPTSSVLALNKQEKFLLMAVRKYAAPSEENELTLGLGHCLELGLFYLDQWRLEEADRFFTDLASNRSNNALYIAFGRLGHGITLAFENRAEESVQVIIDALNEKDPAVRRVRFFLNRHPRLLQMLARAVDYNAANYAAKAKTLPLVLQDFRKPPLISNTRDKMRQGVYFDHQVNSR